MPSTATDVIDGVSTSVAVKAPVRVATTANIALTGLQTIDGITVVAGDRVLVKDQTDQADNGIWVAGTSTWQRAKDFDGSRDAVQGTLIPIVSGNGDYAMYQVASANPIIIGSSNISFYEASYAALAANLANAANDALGAALIGYDGDTVADALNDTMVVSGARFGFTAATNIDAEMAAWVAAYANTGTVLKLRPGIYIITQHYEIQGWTLDLSAGAEIEVNGTDADTAYSSGALEILTGGKILGGIVYTSGSMEGTFGAASCVLLCNGGDIEETTVYSQINAGIRHISGKLNNPIVYGGKWFGVNCQWGTDTARDIEVRTFNSGVRYIGKAPAAVANTTVGGTKACNVNFSVNITAPVKIKFSGAYSCSSGLWVERASGSFTMTDVVVDTPIFNRAGYCLISGTVLTAVDTTGTAIEIVDCPNVAVFDPESKNPLGYNIAVARCANGTVHGGVSIGLGGDPNTTVVDSDEFTFYDHYAEGGSVGYSIGEDGATSNNVKLIGCTGKDNTYGPIRLNFSVSDVALFIDRFTAINGSTNAAFSGSYSGPGELYDFLRVYNHGGVTANVHVSLTNSTLSGAFTEIVRPYETVVNVSLYENNNTYSCPFVPPPVGEHFRGRGRYHTPTTGIPIITGSSGGRANTGTFTINNATVNSSYVMNVTDITPYVGTKAANSFDAADFWLVFYVKYSTDMSGELRIGLDDSGASSTSRYGLTTYLSSTVNNSNTLLGDGYQIGEWMAFAHPLTACVYSGVADWAALTRLQVIKAAYSVNYELVMTNPVIVMRKSIA